MRSGAWKDVDVPALVRAVPTMVDPDETQLLYALARDTFHGAGRIIDAGCFLGGSTIALAQGLRDAGHTGRAGPSIDVYDRFIAEDYSVAEGWFDGQGLGKGDSFRPLFDHHLDQLHDLIEVHEGDITEARFDQPIELLFLDVLKTWPIHDEVIGRTFPLLLPGAVVVQQDYWSGTLPWIQVTMAHLGDHFEQLADVGGSRVYAVTTEIPADEVEACRRGRISGARMGELFDQLLDAEPDRTRQGLLLVNKAQMQFREVGSKEFRSTIAMVESQWGDDPVVVDAVRRVQSFMFPGAGILAAVLRPTGVLRRF